MKLFIFAISLVFVSCGSNPETPVLDNGKTDKPWNIQQQGAYQGVFNQQGR
ncbi:hypothetical protein N9085_01340 [Akkermansiaceae bacterium]|nr:hypothetical protein [Akkermansiaceae bacterium]MDB4416782.1 hypothetical protein [bacterium]MDB4440302.1 hypothetical protein [bacterium]MDB4562987.1 hypothetical protein [Akkermansiaceae bacterium]MDB4585452.1 hypothetical protein [Akkermansiaceae bacterium]